jgi:hypothetical protein
MITSPHGPRWSPWRRCAFTTESRDDDRVLGGRTRLMADHDRRMAPCSTPNNDSAFSALTTHTQPQSQAPTTRSTRRTRTKRRITAG